MGEQITSENILDKLKWHSPEQTPTVCLVAGNEIARLREDVERLSGSLNWIQRYFVDYQTASRLEVEYEITNALAYLKSINSNE